MLHGGDQWLICLIYWQLNKHRPPERSDGCKSSQHLSTLDISCCLNLFRRSAGRTALCRRPSLLHRIAAAAALLGAQFGASAQQATSPDAAATTEPGKLPTVTVTAERRRENARDVPNSISVVSGELLDAVNTSGQDLRDTELFQRSLKLGLISNGMRDPGQSAIRENAETKEAVFQLGGMWCTSCGWLIEHALAGLRGIAVSGDEGWEKGLGEFDDRRINNFDEAFLLSLSEAVPPEDSSPESAPRRDSTRPRTPSPARTRSCGLVSPSPAGAVSLHRGRACPVSARTGPSRRRRPG